MALWPPTNAATLFGIRPAEVEHVIPPGVGEGARRREFAVREYESERTVCRVVICSMEIHEYDPRSKAFVDGWINMSIFNIEGGQFHLIQVERAAEMDNIIYATFSGVQ